MKMANRQPVSTWPVMTTLLVLWVIVACLLLTAVKPEAQLNRLDIPVGTDVADVYRERMEAYRQDLGLFAINLKLQAMTVALAALVAFLRKNDNHELPAILELKLPLDIWYWVVPILGFYLWIQFGYLFDRLIDNRLALWSILHALGDPRDGSTLSRTALLRDTGFLDAYFIAFHPTKHAIYVPDPKGLVTSHLYLYCALVALTHVAILSTIWTAIARKAHSLVPQVVGFVLFFATLFALGASHYQFIRAGHVNSMQWQVILSTGVVTLALQIFLSRRRGSEQAAAASAQTPAKQ